MSYFSNEEPALGSWLGCGPGCNCGPCQSGVSGFGQRYEADEDEEPFEIRTPGPPGKNVARPAPLSGWSRNRLGFFSIGDEQPAEPAREAPAQDTQQTTPEPAPGPGPSAPDAAPPTPTPSTPGPANTDADLQAIRAAIGQGIRNPKRLTDLVFFARHPDRKGNPNWMNEPGLFEEWQQIRHELVLPETRKAFRPRPQPPRPRIIYRTRRPGHSRLHGYPGFGYFAGPVCDPSRHDLNAIADDLKLINNEIAKGAGASAHRMSLKRQLLDLDVDGMIHALDSYIASGCCEPSLKTLESEINALPWPLLVAPTRLRLAAGIVAAQGRAKKDFEHC